MLKHRITALFAGVGLATGLMATVAATSASATTPHCKVTVTQIQAWELQDGDGRTRSGSSWATTRTARTTSPRACTATSPWVARAPTR